MSTRLALGVAALLACAACERAAAVGGGDVSPVFKPPVAAEAFWLSATGLYRDIRSKELVPGVREFQPAYALWTDGANKRRWLRLPEGARIDTSDMDHWRFPAGTLLFKEFSLQGRRIETRLIARMGPEPSDTWLGAFVWNDDESDARFVPDGMRDARSTSHDVPSNTQCLTCHGGEPGRVLGFSAIQQPGVAPELLTHAPPEPYAPPGDATAAAALGYLHANCGHCHNPDGSARPDSDMVLRLSVAEHRVEDTGIYRSTVRRRLQAFRADAVQLRVAPGDANRSALALRMAHRERQLQMPPIGTERVDAHGLALVRTWIDAL